MESDIHAESRGPTKPCQGYKAMIVRCIRPSRGLNIACKGYKVLNGMINKDDTKNMRLINLQGHVVLGILGYVEP